MIPIGPKVQVHVPDDHAAFIRGEAERRGVREPDVTRELIALGIATLELARRTGRLPSSVAALAGVGCEA